MNFIFDDSTCTLWIAITMYSFNQMNTLKNTLRSTHSYLPGSVIFHQAYFSINFEADFHYIWFALLTFMTILRFCLTVIIMFACKVLKLNFIYGHKKNSFNFMQRKVNWPPEDKTIVEFFVLKLMWTKDSSDELMLIFQCIRCHFLFVHNLKYCNFDWLLNGWSITRKYFSESFFSSSSSFLLHFGVPFLVTIKITMNKRNDLNKIKWL